MKKLILFAVIGLMFSGCVTRSKCDRKFPPQTIIITKDSIINTTTTIYSDTLVYVHLPADTITNVVLVDNATIFRPSLLKLAYSQSEAYIHNKRLYHSLIQNDTLIAYRLENAIRITWERAEKYYTEKQTIVKEVRWIPKWAWVSLSISIIALLFVAIKIYKFLTLRF